MGLEKCMEIAMDIAEEAHGNGNQWEPEDCWLPKTVQALRRAIAEALEEEREACAKVCDNNACDYTREGAEVCAAEIRARSNVEICGGWE